MFLSITNGLYCIPDIIYKTVYFATDVAFHPDHSETRGVILVVGGQLLLYTAEIRVLSGYNAFSKGRSKLFLAAQAERISGAPSAWMVKSRAIA